MRQGSFWAAVRSKECLSEGIQYERQQQTSCIPVVWLLHRLCSIVTLLAVRAASKCIAAWYHSRTSFTRAIATVDPGNCWEMVKEEDRLTHRWLRSRRCIRARGNRYSYDRHQGHAVGCLSPSDLPRSLSPFG